MAQANSDLTPISHWRENSLLYSAAFFQGLGLTIWGLTTPLILKSLGASDGTSGTVCSAYNWLYLFACLSTVAVISRFQSKPLLAIGTTLIAAASGAILVVIALNARQMFPVAPIPVITAFVAIMGAATALFWPPLMSWISGQHSGRELNRRLGAFSVSWSSGALLAPLLGSYAVEVSATWAQALAFAFSAIAWISILLAKQSISPVLNPPDNEAELANHLPDHVSEEQARAYRWMSRIALLVVFWPIGTIRTHLPILLTIDLKFDAVTFGVVMTAFSIVQTLMYAAIGKTHRWHYHPIMFWGSQVAMIASFGALAVVQSVSAFIVMAIILAVMQTFIYASHLYYGVSGGAKRSRVTTIHELVLSAGYALGAMAAGMISDALGRRAPYVWITVAMIVAVIIEAIICRTLLKKRSTPTSPAAEADGAHQVVTR